MFLRHIFPLIAHYNGKICARTGKMTYSDNDYLEKWGGIVWIQNVYNAEKNRIQPKKHRIDQ